MTDQTNTQNLSAIGMSLASIAERAEASGAWWQEETIEQSSDLVLPTRVLVALGNAGINTVEQLKAAGPTRLRKIEGIGNQAFDQIIALLRALDRQANGGDS